MFVFTLLLLVLNKIKTTRLSVKVINKFGGCKNPSRCGQRRRANVIYSSSSSEQGDDRPPTVRRSRSRSSSRGSRGSEASMPPSYRQVMRERSSSYQLSERSRSRSVPYDRLDDQYSDSECSLQSNPRPDSSYNPIMD